MSECRYWSLAAHLCSRLGSKILAPVFNLRFTFNIGHLLVTFTTVEVVPVISSQ